MKTGADLRQVIDRTIARFYAYTKPTAHEVGTAVIAENPGLISELGANLAAAHVYSLVSDRMKISVSTDGEQQLKLDIPIAHLSAAISFPSEKEIRFVRLDRATWPEMQAHMELLRDQIVNDQRRLHAFEILSDMLGPIMETTSEMTVGEAYKIYNRRGYDDDNHGIHPQI